MSQARACTVCGRRLPEWEPGEICAACWRVAKRVAEEAGGHVVGVSAEGVRVTRPNWLTAQLFPWPGKDNGSTAESAESAENGERGAR